MAQALSFQDFQAFLANALTIREEKLTPDAALVNDLAVDSLKLVELMMRLENELGVSVSAEDAWKMGTVGDAYNFYVEYIGR